MKNSLLVKLGLAVSALGLLARAHAQDAPLFRFDLKPGAYGVGLKVVEQYDATRVYHSATDELGKPYAGARARPLQTLIWYPANKRSAKPMTVKDYADLLPNETNFTHPQASVWKDFVAGMQPTMSSPLWAVRDAQLVPGHFPVVIYAPSISAMSWENADLCEYLASHGYVVIATPDFGATGRAMTNSLPGIEAEAHDISFLIGYAQTLTDTDMSKIAVAAFSWGGMANLFAAAKDSRIKAMVELDSSLRYWPGMIKDAGYVHPEQMTIPMLYLSHGEQSLEQLVKRTAPGLFTFNVLNEWTHGDLVYVNMMGFIHGEFASMSQRNEYFWKAYEKNHVADYTRADGTIGYALESRYVLAFLDSYLKGDAEGTKFLHNTPAENGAPAHFISVIYRKAKGLAPTLETLQVEAGKQGFDHLPAIYAAMKKETPDFKPGAVEMSAWAYDLSASSHTPEAIEVLKLDLQVNPDAPGIYAALGDAYVQEGAKDLAINSYKLQLEKTPGDVTVADKLKALGQ